MSSRADASAGGLSNVHFAVADVGDFHERAEPKAFDFITTFDAIHDQAKPLNVLKGIHRALREDGLYLMQDIKGSSHIHKNISHPLGTFLYTVSCMHCMTVSLAQAGEGLGAMWGEEKTREYLGLAGFRFVEKHELAQRYPEQLERPQEMRRQWRRRTRLATYRVGPGKEEAFIKAWNDLAAAFQAVHEPCREMTPDD